MMNGGKGCRIHVVISMDLPYIGKCLPLKYFTCQCSSLETVPSLYFHCILIFIHIGANKLSIFKLTVKNSQYTYSSYNTDLSGELLWPMEYVSSNKARSCCASSK